MAVEGRVEKGHPPGLDMNCADGSIEEATVQAPNISMIRREVASKTSIFRPFL